MVRMEKTLAAYGIKPKKEKFVRKFRFTVDKDELNKYSDLERLFESQRVENEAAISLQRWYRRTQVLIPWRTAVRQQQSIIQIQRIVRGAVTRKFVADWYNKRNTIVIGWQACSRKFTYNIHTRAQLKLELESCYKIQRFSRMVLARWKCRRILTNIAAARIQCLWRGCVGRSQADKIWLNSSVVIIQKIIRGDLAKKKSSSMTFERALAADKIQRTYRNFTSLGRVQQAMAEREMRYRLDTIDCLSAEEEHYQVQMEKMMGRMMKKSIKAKAERALRNLYAHQERIYAKENDLIEIRRQADILTPRTREQGWLEELKRNEKGLMVDLKNMKIEALFKYKAEVDQNDELLEQQVLQIEQLADSRDRVSHWREQEYEERRHYNFHRDVVQHRKNKSRAVADEKRRWQVLYYTSDGKPDKRKRPGQPWDPAVFSGPNKQTYSGGLGVDLLNHTKMKDPTHKAGSDPAVNKAVDGISLQAYLEQVNTYEQLLQPVISILQKYSGGTGISEHKDAQKMGFGPIGARLAPALRGIGALPALPEEAPAEEEEEEPQDLRARARLRLKAYRESGETGGIDDVSVLTGDSSIIPLGDLRSGTPGSARSGGSTARSSQGTPPRIRASNSASSPSAIGGGGFVDSVRIKQELRKVVKASKEKPPAREKSDLNSRPPSLSSSIENLSLPRFGRDQKKHRQAGGGDVQADGESNQFSDRFREGVQAVSREGEDVADDNGNVSVMLIRGLDGDRQESSQEDYEEERVMAVIQAQEAMEERKRFLERRRQQKAQNRQSSTIPWTLLDQLDGEKRKAYNWRAHVDYTSKI